MAIWRTVGRLAAVLAAAAGLLLAGATAALADSYSVDLGLPSGFRTGGSAGAVSVKITKGEDGCVNARWAVTLELPGLSADQIHVERSLDGSWRRVNAQAVGDGTVAWGAEGPLCKGRAINARYRVAFLAPAPIGRATFTARAWAAGHRIGSDSGTRKVVAGRNASPSPSPSETRSESPTPAADESAGAAGGPAGPTRPAAGGTDAGGFLSGVSLIIMIFGVLMVGIGGALLVLVVRKMRAETEFDAPPGDPATTMVLPRVRHTEPPGPLR
jgi:hypothetical protein